jgi:hypothetical protein
MTGKLECRDVRICWPLGRKDIDLIETGHANWRRLEIRQAAVLLKVATLAALVVAHYSA